MSASSRPPCVYECGRPSGSREHLFPAVCGGIRRNKRISCELCNNTLSPLDEELARAFASVNGLLGVKNRDRDEVPSLATERRLRRRLSLSRKDGKVRILSRWIRWLELGGEKVLQVSGDDEVLRRLAENGATFTEGVHPQLIIELTYQVRLSNPALRRAIARLVLHFLATIDPEGARSVGTSPIRRYVREGDTPRTPFVWVDHDTDTFRAIPQSFGFGHRVAIHYSSADQRIWGHVSMYSCFGYGIDLGPAQIASDRSYSWDIDPLADREPNDQVAHAPGSELRFASPRNTLPAEADHRIRYLFNEVRRRNWLRDAPAIVSAVNATRHLSLENSEDRIFDFLSEQRQRLLALATESISFLEFWLEHPRGRTRLERTFRSLISARSSGHWGVSRTTWRLVEELKRDIARALAKRLISRPLNAWDVAAILVGMEGQAVALRRLALTTRSRASVVSVEAAHQRLVSANTRSTENLRRVSRQLVAAARG